MEPGYTLEWLDLLISQTLDPERSDLPGLTNQQTEWITENVTKEKVRHLSLIKNYVFSIHEENKIQLVVSQYYAALAGMVLRLKANHAKMPPNSQRINGLFNFITNAIEEIMSMIAERFSQYLNPGETVPDSYLAKIRTGIAWQVTSVRNNLLLSDSEDRLIFTTLGLFDTLLEERPNKEVSIGELAYMTQLLSELQQMQLADEETVAFFSPLETLLIRMNFNHPFYVRYLTEKITEQVLSTGQDVDRIEKMHYFYQHFHQIQVKKSVVYDRDCPGLQAVIGNWFAQEIIYIEKKFHSEPLPVQGQRKLLSKAKPVTRDGEQDKILCILSVDQMALFLKAADEMKILSAKSLSVVFKKIAPHLSTPYQEDISGESMRTKTYNPEDRDKKIIIETLQKMIRKISEY